MTRFLNEVHRLLRNGGYFLLADLRTYDYVEEFNEQLEKYNLNLLRRKDITENIVLALDLDNDKKSAFVKNVVHRALVKPFLEFAGTRGSVTYQKFKNRKIIYQSFVFQK